LDSIRIDGGIPLEGSLHIQGSKNAALPMMAAAILHEGITVLHHCPKITDVKYMEEILKSLGAAVWWEGNTVYIDAASVSKHSISKEYAENMRSSIVVLGSLLGRCQEAAIPYPGGCVIGSRPIDFHLMALEKLGAVIEEKDDILYVNGKELTGATVVFSRSSVGATQNALLAAVKAKGRTILKGCAIEPEVIWLCRFLRQMGAQIQGIGSDTLSIKGVTVFQNTEFIVPPDRIVAGTYVCACAITRGEICIENALVGEMEALLDVYTKMGGQYEVKGGKLLLDGKRVKRPVSYLETEIHPGFPTDMQSPVMAVLAAIPGKSHIRETIFEDRFKVVSQLLCMGADIKISGKDAWIEGVPTLRGATVSAQELRGGAALVIAALGAHGETCIENRHFIERGYEHICEDISSLGGSIRKT